MNTFVVTILGTDPKRPYQVRRNVGPWQPVRFPFLDQSLEPLRRDRVDAVKRPA